MTDVSTLLAEYVVRTQFDDIPPDVLHECRRSFVNWMGCTLGGCRHQAVELALPVVTAAFAGGQAAVLGRAERASAAGAAFLNAISNNAYFFNDTHLPTVCHPAAPVVSVLLAMAESWPMTGRDFLLAMMLGIEIQCRIGNVLVGAGAESHPGLYMAGLVGPAGGAVAASRILRLNEDKTSAAIGLAVTQGGGLRESFATLSSHVICGQSTAEGLLAAMFAAAGISGPRASLEGPNGLAAVLARNADPGVAVRGLGDTYETLLNSYKPYPCGILVHPIIDLCMDLRRQNGLTADRIEHLDFQVSPAALALTGRKEPRNAAEAGTSLYHWAAAALIDGRAGLEQRSDKSVQNPDVIALRGRIHATQNESIAPEAARVTVTLVDGSTLSLSVEHARGCHSRPMTDRDLDEKFLGQAEMILASERARLLLQKCWSIGDADDVATYLGLSTLH